MGQVEIYIAEKGLYIEPEDVFNYWDKKHWLTKKGEPVKTLESAINVVNGLIARKIRKRQSKYTQRSSLRTDVKRYLGGLPNVYECTQESAYNRKMVEYISYTSGSCACLSELRPGGCAYIIMSKWGNIIRARNYGRINTSSRRMELLAIVSAATFTPERSCLDIYTDSQYCINVLTGKWSATANTDLVEKFKLAAKDLKSVVFHWVKGHSGDPYNEMVDDMAYTAFSDQVDKYNLNISKNSWKSQPK